MVDFLRTWLVEGRMIDQEDSMRILMTDSPEEAVRFVIEVARDQVGLTYGPQARRRWFLWE
jgi:hypothetical protein